MFTSRSFCVTWAVFVLAQVVSCFNVKEHCRRRCLMGRGGILCNCNAMHFNGKRSSPLLEGNNNHKHVQPLSQPLNNIHYSNPRFHKSKKEAQNSLTLQLHGYSGKPVSSSLSKYADPPLSAMDDNMWEILSQFPDDVQTVLINDVSSYRPQNKYVADDIDNRPVSDSVINKIPISSSSSSFSDLDRSMANAKWMSSSNGNDESSPTLKRKGEIPYNNMFGKNPAARSSRSDEDSGSNEYNKSDDKDGNFKDGIGNASPKELSGRRDLTEEDEDIAKVVNDMIHRLEVRYRHGGKTIHHGMMEPVYGNSPINDNDFEIDSNSDGDRNIEDVPVRNVEYGMAKTTNRETLKNRRKSSSIHKITNAKKRSDDIRGNTRRLRRLFSVTDAMKGRSLSSTRLYQKRHF